MSEVQTLALAEAISPVDAVRRLLQFIGEDPGRDGLRDTPDRVCRALREMTSGYLEDAEAVLGRVFEENGYDEMILVRGVSFTSLCEHHLLPFSGTATVGYIPAEGRVVGLSKLARVVDIFARRLQLQERLTTEIADTIERVLSPLGVGVVLRASHSCLSCRGAHKPGAVMVTSRLLGTLRDAAARAEFLSLTGGG